VPLADMPSQRQGNAKKLTLCALGGAVLGAVAAFAFMQSLSFSTLLAGGVVGGAFGAGGYVLWRQALLRAQDDFFRSLLYVSPTGHALTHADGTIVLSNPALHGVFGMPDKMVRLGDFLGHHDEATVRQIEYLAGIAQRGGHDNAEVLLRQISGTMSWFNVDTRPLSQRPGYVTWRFEDISARKEMEDVIREERGKLVDFLDNAAAGFYSVDQSGSFHYVNYTFAQWLGLRPDEMLKGTIRLHDLLAEPPPRGTAAHELTPSWSAETGGEVVFKTRDGRKLPVTVVQTVTAEVDGSLKTRSIVRDLSSERRLMEAARRSEELFRKLFDDSPIGVAVLDGDGQVLECNPAFRTFTGGEGTKPLGRRFQDLLTTEDVEPIARRIRDIAAGTRADAPVEVHVSGARARIGAIYMSRMDSDGPEQKPQVLARLIDLTQQKYFETQAAQSQKMQAVGQLAGGIAHDFNNLLTVMIGFCDLLLLRHRPGEQTFADIMQIKQNANRAANLVRQLLAFSRQQTLQPKVLDVTDVLADLSNLLRRLIGVNISLKVVHGRDLGLVRVDQVQLEQVLINLVVNARDAMPKGGTLTVRTSNLSAREPTRRGAEIIPPGNYILLEVTDTGIGIPSENLERIFEPFFSTKEVGAGTGLGLATVYGIVKQTGGFIAVDSRVSAGSTFAIYLPRHGEEPEGVARAKIPGGTQEEQEEVRDLTGAGTVLLVEDEDAVRLFASRALKNKGYAVIEAKNGEKAMEAIESAGRRLDLLITDVMMPAMDGPTLVKAARLRFPELKVIFISGYAEDTFREKVENDEAIHFLPKPFSLLQLAGKVKQVMG
jgi:two-component system cell cycle sensor histidine kinase/response regulator CckA